jgi:peptide/nickel transport system substrate-binding protein
MPPRRHAALALGLAALLLLAGCAGQAPRRGPASGAAKEVLLGTTDRITSLDPGQGYEILVDDIFWNTHATLLTYRTDGAGVVPELASGMPTVSPDGTTYTFHLRQGLRFSDGSPITARDFLWTLDRNSGKVGGVEGDPAFLIYASPGVDLANSTAPDDLTLVIRLVQPAVYFTSLVAFPNFAPLPRSQYTKDRWVEPTGGTANLPVSSGPYQVVDYRPNEYIKLGKNPDYNGPRVAKNDAVTVKLFSNSGALKAAVQNGEVDVAYRTFRVGDWNDLKAREATAAATFRTYEATGPSPLRFLAVQVQKAPFTDVRLRQALALLVDRDEVARVVYQGAVSPAYSIVPTGLGFLGQKDSWKDKYGAAPDPARAARLLAAAGYSTANRLTFDLWFPIAHYGDEEPDLATVLKKQFEASGMVSVNIRSEEWSVYRPHVVQGSFPVFLIGWFPDYLDADDYATPLVSTAGSRQFGTYYSNARVDDLVAQEQRERDPGLRAAVFEQLQDAVADDVPLVPLFTGKMEAAAKATLRGVVLPPHQLLPYYTLEG